MEWPAAYSPAHHGSLACVLQEEIPLALCCSAWFVQLWDDSASIQLQLITERLQADTKHCSLLVSCSRQNSSTSCGGAQPAGVKEGILSKGSCAEPSWKSSWRFQCLGELEWKSPAFREGWRERRITKLHCMEAVRYFSSKQHSQTRKDPSVGTCWAIAILGSAVRKKYSVKKWGRTFEKTACIL